MNFLEKIKETSFQNIEKNTIPYEIFNLKKIPKTRKSFISHALEMCRRNIYYPDLTIFWINSSKAIEEARFNLEKIFYCEEYSKIKMNETLNIMKKLLSVC